LKIQTQINEKNVVKIRFELSFFLLFHSSNLCHFSISFQPQKQSISDFGLARFYESYYQPQSQATIPVRWSAPEVMKQEKVTSKSDVFSFGVCMWEILEKGKCKELLSPSSLFSSLIAVCPFPSLSVPWIGETNVEVAKAVLRGERLPKPEDCPDELYELMLKCWKANPDERPTFQEVLNGLINFSKTVQVENAAIVQIDQREEPALEYQNPAVLTQESSQP
jgi:serine/threonine protein kinase